ncbi:hypothetical protein [Symbiobacterium terraclitae]|uniref:hypothetical protein n=1 Tax=Symbiobacterium terraclitae TaxID=557451 RepID=UPI0035B55B2B
MSAAPQLTPVQKPRTYTPAAPAAPVAAPVPRPARRTVSIPAVLGLTAAWVALVVVALSLVQTKAAIRQAEAATAAAQRQISLLNEQNLALEAKIANAASVEEVERWALAHGMQQPESVAETLAGREEAVAVRTPREPEPVEAQVTEAEPSFWQALLERVTSRVSSLAAGRR